MATPVIELENVWKAFDEKDVLKGISLSLSEGVTLSVMGGSGEGKTVLLRVIAGLIKPDAGIVRLFGENIVPLREEALLPIRRRTGFVFQGAALFDSLTVFENVAFPLREHTGMSEAEIAERVSSCLATVGLSEAAGLLPAVISGGMRKRAGIARALVMEPEVVFYDEPTAGLDPSNARLVGELIAKLRGGVCKTAVVVTHDQEFATFIADRMAILHDGHILADGPPEAIVASPDPEVQAFLAGEMRVTYGQ
ncbi:MAG TPA: ABC transporter ATP-binding protein [Methylomirabilota bacterium]|nr:ABC transporter ATP-binding protein [Methylomirabilota bacterium]